MPDAAMNSAADIDKSVAGLLPRVTDMRRDIHAHPEPACAEHRTAALVADFLQARGMPVRTGVGGTGVIAEVTGDRSGPVVALRADLDALPIVETSGTPWASTVAGVSHSCGHDGHTAILAGTCAALAENRALLSGTARAVFQPAEEAGNGAVAMIAGGALDKPVPAAIFAVHAWPGLPTGHVASLPGQMAAANDTFTLTLSGRGGHGARPAEARSPLPALADFIQRAGTLTRTAKHPAPPRIVSVCAVRAGDRPNVIPADAVAAGTVRTTDEDCRRETHRELARVAEAAAASCGISAEIDFTAYCPAVVNDPGLYDLFEQVADEFLGPGVRSRRAEPSMGSEDFARYLAAVPGLLARIGVGTEAGTLHHGGFDFNDGALGNGMKLMAGLAIRTLDLYGKTDTP